MFDDSNCIVVWETEMSLGDAFLVGLIIGFAVCIMLLKMLGWL